MPSYPVDETPRTPRPPAKPARLTIRFVESGDRLVFTYRRRGWGKGGFLLLWLIGWTVGCVFLAGIVIRDPSIQNILFGIPFWASWIFVFCWLLNTFFGRDYVGLDATGVDFVRRVIVPIRSRHVPLTEIERFEICSKVVDSESNQVEWGIEMQTLGRPVRFAWGLDAEERQWLQHQLNACLAALSGSDVETIAATSEPPSQEHSQADSEEPAAEVLTPSTTAAEPPSDCRWERTDDFAAITFTQRGRFSLSAFFGLLFINAFWNGIVSVFVFQLWFGQGNGVPNGIGWWGMFAFLIPFEVIGAVMFLALVAVVLEPLRRTSWRFDDALIDCRVKWLGLGPIRQYWVDGLDRIELVGMRRSGRAKRRTQASLFSDEDADKKLVFIDEANAEVCTIRHLTEGEARWISDVVQRERSIWFR